jgi:predicted transcriptional regulator
LKTCKWHDISIFDNMMKGATKLEREKQIPALQDDDWGYLSEAEIEGIKAGLDDIEAGRIRSHEDVMAHIDKKLNSMR